MFKSISNIFLICKDLERSRNFYSSYLELKEKKKEKDFIEYEIGSNCPTIEEIIYDLNEDYFNGITDMYAGLALQRSYFAKQKSANENAWETTNESLSDTVRILYEESIEFSIQLESDYIFQHDVKLTYNDILVLRTENYLILGNIEKAILSFNQIDFDQLGFEVDEACEQGIDFDSSKLIECLCIVSHNGFCPFGD